MKDYFLFIDTEASSLPKNWNLPYSTEGNWPNSLQISWLICNKAGDLIKQEDHYINDNDFTIDQSAIKVHGITREFLNQSGKPRAQVLNILAEDIEKYSPLVVGYFMEFDAHMVAADFYRLGLESPIKAEESFCAMLATKFLARNPSAPYLKLSQLYRLLLDEKLNNPHNALEDAKATAACFFELVRRGDITEETISKQQAEIANKTRKNKKFGCLPFIIISLGILSYLCL